MHFNSNTLHKTVCIAATPEVSQTQVELAGSVTAAHRPQLPPPLHPPPCTPRAGRARAQPLLSQWPPRSLRGKPAPGNPALCRKPLALGQSRAGILQCWRGESWRLCRALVLSAHVLREGSPAVRTHKHPVDRPLWRNGGLPSTASPSRPGT